MKDLILRANYLWLENCMWDHKDLNLEIKHLVVLHYPKKRFIVDNFDGNHLQTKQVFSCLITLMLKEMRNLEQLFQDASIKSLPVLQELSIETCLELRNCIFTNATVTSLPKLRELRICDCGKVKWLFPYSLACHCPSLEELRIQVALNLRGSSVEMMMKTYHMRINYYTQGSPFMICKVFHTGMEVRQHIWGLLQQASSSCRIRSP
ncbi:uncharacterized protein LOC129317855 [Prosopis cineraria]|uniref:uncharacterized protein LOC129317855 n=1 Tax=Prosopis cineraria TaxID=364024 RepID=UPI00240EB365|nr:uncharacterized protein LOC129317855 [Prosopis cineraria]